jgi:hypothetical protein
MDQPHFYLKSNRDYLHGPTVFDAIVNGLDHEPRDIDFSFLKRTSKNCLLSTELPPAELLVAEYTDAKGTVYVAEDKGELEEVHEYNEDLIAASCSIMGKAASIELLDQRYSTIESLVPAYKFLLQDLFGSDAKYVFARIKLTHLPTRDVSIQYQRLISNNFYQAAIYEADNKLGFILFGEWK